MLCVEHSSHKNSYPPASARARPIPPPSNGPRTPWFISSSNCCWSSPPGPPNSPPTGVSVRVWIYLCTCVYAGMMHMYVCCDHVCEVLNFNGKHSSTTYPQPPAYQTKQTQTHTPNSCLPPHTHTHTTNTCLPPPGNPSPATEDGSGGLLMTSFTCRKPQLEQDWRTKRINTSYFSPSLHTPHPYPPSVLAANRKTFGCQNLWISIEALFRWYTGLYDVSPHHQGIWWNPNQTWKQIFLLKTWSCTEQMKGKNPALRF